MQKPLRRAAALLVLSTLLCMLTGCISISPKPVPGVTAPPISTPAPVETPVVTNTPDPTQRGDTTRAPVVSNTDALGNVIYTSDHFERYVTFTDITVYEEPIFSDDGNTEETLIDCKAVNAYPELLLCAVNVTFLDENGFTIATGSLQMPDGSFLIALESGETPLYARILTDTVLTDKRFTLSFDPVTGVHPQG